MTRQLGFISGTIYRAALVATGLALALSACGRSGTSAPPPITTANPTTNPLSGGVTPTTTDPNATAQIPSIPTTGTGTGDGTGTGTGTGTIPQTFSCTLTLVSGSPLATVLPQTPSMVNYLLAITPNITNVPQPVISTDPVNRFIVDSMVPNGSSVTITGNFNAIGSTVVKASVNVSGQMTYCQTTTVVTEAPLPVVAVNRFDRVSPPDIFYATSNAAPAGFTPAGPMFYIFSQPPPASKCAAIELNECILPRSPQSVTFLTQAVNCGGYPVVAKLGYTCGSNVSGTKPLYRMTNDIDFRYYTTARYEDIAYMQAQGWRYEGIIGYVPMVQ